MPSRLLFLVLLGLLVPLTACGGDSATGGDTPGDSTAAGEGADEAPAAGTYRAYFIYSGAAGYDTTAVMEGDLAAPIPASEITSVALPAHGDNIRVSNETWPLPDGLRDASFLLSYREPDGDLAIYATSFSSPRFCNVNPDTTDLRAVAIAPMWSSEAPSHPMTVFNVDGNDSLATFDVTRPAADNHTIQIDGSAAAGQQSVQLVLEVQWADGRARPVIMAFRGQSGGWWGSMMEANQTAVAREGVQFYKDGLGLDPEHPMVFITAFEE